MHCRVAVLHDLISVTVGAKPRHDTLSLSCSRRSQQDMERGKGHLCNTTTCATASSTAAPAQVQECASYARKCGITASAKSCMERITLWCAMPPKAKLHPKYAIPSCCNALIWATQVSGLPKMARCCARCAKLVGSSVRWRRQSSNL